MIKINVSEFPSVPPPPPPPSFPRLMKVKLSHVHDDPRCGYCVLFTAAGHGTVLWAGDRSNFVVGNHQYAFVDEAFEDFTGVLHLENVK